MIAREGNHLTMELMMLRMPRKKIAVVPLRDPDMIGSLYIPDVAKERVDQGLVKYIGPESELGLKIGDHVLFSGYTGTLLRLEDEGDLIILPEEFVTAIIAETPWEVPGLYFKAKDGTYFQATSEMALELVTHAYPDSMKPDVKTHRPPKNEVTWK